LGGGTQDGANTYMYQTSFVEDVLSETDAFSSLMTITAVPEPSKFVLAALGILGLMPLCLRRASAR
jgi:hypothetical protein